MAYAKTNLIGYTETDHQDFKKLMIQLTCILVNRHIYQYMTTTIMKGRTSVSWVIDSFNFYTKITMRLKSKQQMFLVLITEAFRPGFLIAVCLGELPIV